MEQMISNDPIELGHRIQKILIKDGKRFFGQFMVEETADGEELIANAYSNGCNVKCFYCASTMRDYGDGYVPDINLKGNKASKLVQGYYSPEELLSNYLTMVEGVKAHPKIYRNRTVNQFAILDCETSIGMDYIFELLDKIKQYNIQNNTKYRFVLFTNGIILGNDLYLVDRLAEYRDVVCVRTSIKAGSAYEFGVRLDIDEKYFEAPFKAIARCVQIGIEVQIAVLNDPCIMSKEEFNAICNKLEENGYRGPIFQEKLIMGRGCIQRIKSHSKKYPDYNYRFSFRKNALILYENEKDMKFANRIKTGFYRVSGNAPIVKNCKEYIESSNYETLIILKDLAYENYQDIHTYANDNKYVKEIVVLNTSKNTVNELREDYKGVKISTQNIHSLINISDDPAILDSPSQVHIGMRLSYFCNQ